MTSFGACGDVVRNVVSCPGSTGRTAVDARLRDITSQLAKRFARRRARTGRSSSTVTRPHHAKRSPSARSTATPIFRASSRSRSRTLTRTASTSSPRTWDSFPAVHPVAGDGFTVLVGGGLGRAYANPDTFSRLADPMAFVTYDELEEVIAAIVATYRELGDRTDRKRARMKYVVADMGSTSSARRWKFDSAETYVSRWNCLRRSRPTTTWDGVTRRRQLAGRATRLGRTGARRDDGPRAAFTALRHIAQALPVTFFLTAQQDMVISAIPRTTARRSKRSWRHVTCAPMRAGHVERTALACPALPTCGQALTEAERRLPELVGTIEGELGQRETRATFAPTTHDRMSQWVRATGRSRSRHRGTHEVHLRRVRRRRAARRPSGDPLSRKGLLRGDRPPCSDHSSIAWESESDIDESFGDFVTRVGVSNDRLPRRRRPGRRRSLDRPCGTPARAGRRRRARPTGREFGPRSSQRKGLS